MYDAAKHELVWRGVASKTLDPKAKPETPKESGQSRRIANEELSAASEKVREVQVGWISRERESEPSSGDL